MKTALVKVKLVNKNAKVPEYSSAGAAGADITCVSFEKEKAINFIDRWFPVFVYRTGIQLEIPETHWGMLAARSSIAKVMAWLANSIGVIDSDYRGEIIFKFRAMFPPYEVGDRIGQIIYVQKHTAIHKLFEDLTDTERGEGGFGSTGK